MHLPQPTTNYPMHSTTALHQLWEQLWVNQENFFAAQPVNRDPIPLEDPDVSIPASCTMMRGHPSITSIAQLLVRDEYIQARQFIESYWSQYICNSVVIAGQSGIGKSLFLYYLLILRLSNRQPTVYQRQPGQIILFNQDGVFKLTDDLDYPTTLFPPRLWALVDLNSHVERPAAMLVADSSPFFVIQASPPYEERWASLARYMAPCKIWRMKPFTFPELIQARGFQNIACTEANIRQFFIQCGPSARDCYTSSHDIPSYLHRVCRKVELIGWDNIADALLHRTPLDDRIIVVGPQPGDRSSAVLQIATKTVAALVWLLRYNASTSASGWLGVCRTLLEDASTVSSAGWLLERRFHDVFPFEEDLIIRPMPVANGMQIQDGNRTYLTFTNNTSVEPTNVAIPKMKICPLSANNQPTSLDAEHYYKPSADFQLGFDSFVYDPVSHQITMFQITAETIHEVSKKGTAYLVNLAESLGVRGVTLRYVAVVPEGHRVEYRLPLTSSSMVTMFYLDAAQIL